MADEEQLCTLTLGMDVWEQNDVVNAEHHPMLNYVCEEISSRRRDHDQSRVLQMCRNSCLGADGMDFFATQTCSSLHIFPGSGRALSKFPLQGEPWLYALPREHHHLS